MERAPRRAPRDHDRPDRQDGGEQEEGDPLQSPDRPVVAITVRLGASCIYR
ncbi:MAG: hypothetical protein M3179_06755 [Actinomycetota bacterium]|nr:hypothetical protein [Actinomycetota bacterium]